MATESMKTTPDLSAIKLLGTMCFDQDTRLATQADKALYQKIIIPLCDDFTSRGVHVTNLILATLIIQAARLRNDKCKQALTAADLHTEQDILARLQRIQEKRPIPVNGHQQIKTICVLSRVTIGADINITSIIIHRMHAQFPDSPITLIGPEHLSQLFCQPYIKHQLFEYQRNASKYSRLNQWHTLQQIIDLERAGQTDSEFLLIDPDTRLSQLGLLPLAPEQCTYVLPSRVDQTTQISLPELTNRWLDSILKQTSYHHPAFHVCQTAQPVSNKAFTITINFGVGNDPRKRLSLQFEQELITALISQGNTCIILDSGKGSKEIEQATAIESFLTDRGILKEFPNSFIRIQDSISTLATHIKNSNLFIGYDSCSGHIATACQTPTIICFKGAPNPRFYARWQPQNQATTTTCLEVKQKQLNHDERSLLIHHIIDIASSHNQTFQPA